MADELPLLNWQLENQKVDFDLAIIIRQVGGRKQGALAMRRPDPASKFLFALISLTVVAMGLSAVITEYAPARSTRFGMAGPLFDRDAVSLGVTMIFAGLSPLGVFARRARSAGWWAAGCMTLAVLSVFFGARLLP